jgi:hypothetical protein
MIADGWQPGQKCVSLFIIQECQGNSPYLLFSISPFLSLISITSAGSISSDCDHYGHSDMM